MSWFSWLNPRSPSRAPRVLLAVAAAFFIVIVLVEHETSANVVTAFGFVLPILLVATVRNRWLMVITVALCIAAPYAGLLRPTKPGQFVSAVARVVTDLDWGARDVLK